MKVLHSNLKSGIYRLQVQNLDDLWYLSQIIDTGDIIKSRTLRKIKSNDSEKAASATRKPVTISLSVEKLTYEKDSLRILGTITEAASDDIAHGSHHSFNITENSTLTIQKQQWYKYQLDKVNEASKQQVTSTLICVFDREDACIALLKKYGFDIIAQFSGIVEKKYTSSRPKASFYAEIIGMLHGYAKRMTIEHIVLASPGFFKEDLMKELNDASLKKKIILATCNSVGSNGISEVLKRPEMKEVLKQERAAKETILVEHLLTEISKKGLVAYGQKETKEAADAGAVDKLLLTDAFIFRMREADKFGPFETLIKQVDSMKGSIHIISSSHEAGHELDGLGGIAAILRYKLNY